MADEWSTTRTTSPPTSTRHPLGPGGHGWAALTELERQVAELAADGLTNVELAERTSVSRSTIDRHLHRIYRTLAVTSRDELALVVAERHRRR